MNGNGNSLKGKNGIPLDPEEVSQKIDEWWTTFEASVWDQAEANSGTPKAKQGPGAAASLNGGEQHVLGGGPTGQPIPGSDNDVTSPRR